MHPKSKFVSHFADIAIIFFSFVLVFFTYRQILNVSLTPEDFEWIEKIKTLSSTNLFKVFLPPALGGVEVMLHRVTPFVSLSFWLDWRIGGGNPFYYHVTQLLFHMGVTLLLYQLAKKLFKKSAKIFYPIVVSSSVFFFAVFPFHSETVTWNGARPDIMVTFFYLWSLAFYIRFLESKTWNLFLSVMFFAIAILSKENATTLPVVAVLFSIYLQKKVYWHSLIPFLIVIFFWIINYFFLNPHNEGCTLSCQQFLISRVFLIYLAFSAILLFCLKALRLKETGRLWFYWLLFGLLFSPTIFLPTSERYLYLPSVALALFFGEALAILYKKLQAFSLPINTIRMILIGAVSFIVILEASFLYIRNKRWVVAGAIIDNVLNQTAIYAEDSDDNSNLYFLNLPNGHQKSFVFQGKAFDQMLKLRGIKFKTANVITYNLDTGQSWVKIIDNQTIVVSSNSPFIILPSENLTHDQDGNPVIETELFQETFSNNSHNAKIKFKNQSLKSENSYIFHFDGTRLRRI